MNSSETPHASTWDNYYYSSIDLAQKLGQHEPTEEQQKIIEAGPEPLLIVAGAGSGKTATMTDRIVWLVANGFAQPEEILGVTFTRKAAGELAERVRSQLDKLKKAGLEIGVVGEVDDSEFLQIPAQSMTPHVSTYHSYAQGLVRDYGMYIGIDVEDSLLMSDAAAWQLAQNVVENYEGQYQHISIAPSSLAKAVINLSAQMAEHLKTSQDVEKFYDEKLDIFDQLDPAYSPAGEGEPAAYHKSIQADLQTQKTIAELAAIYQSEKQRQNLMDYGDLIKYAAQIAHDISVASDTEKSKYKFVILDEFQDTSVAQLDLFSSLFDQGHSVTAVGDPRQSIYGFRGASAEGVTHFLSRFRTELGQKPEQKNLSIAWRNSASILDAANGLTKKLNGGVYDTDEDLNPNQYTTPGRVEINHYIHNSLTVFSDYPEQTKQEGSARPEQSNDHDVIGYVSEADAIAQKIKDCQTEGLKIPKTNIPYEENPSIAVLCRKRSQFVPLQAALDKQGVSYEVVGQGGLLAQPEIIDLVSMLQVIADPNRSDALMRLISGARFRLGAADLMAFREISKKVFKDNARDSSSGSTQGGVEELIDYDSLVDALDYLDKYNHRESADRQLSDEAYDRLSLLSDEIKHLRTLADQDLLLVIDEVEKQMLLDIELESKPQAETYNSREYIDHFTEMARSFLREGAAYTLLSQNSDGFSSNAARVDLETFLKWVEYQAEKDKADDFSGETPQGKARVQLLTVHAAKGLEWDAVFVPGLIEGSFPSSKANSWTSASSGNMPWALRGDKESLEKYDWVWEDITTVKNLNLALKEHQGGSYGNKKYLGASKEYSETEERHTAYVAFTRARYFLSLSSYQWQDLTKNVHTPSRYLLEVASEADNFAEYSSRIKQSIGNAEAAGEKYILDNAQANNHHIKITHWDNLSEAEESLELKNRTNPVNDAQSQSAQWPYDPLGNRRNGMDRLAEQVNKYSQLSGEELKKILEKYGDDLPVISKEQLDLLLNKHTQTSFEHQYVPLRISASTVLKISNSSENVKAQWNRPVPARPSPAARIGTAFHEWVEKYLNTQNETFDIEIPEYAQAADISYDEFTEIKAMTEIFLESKWAKAQPYAVEMPFETQIGQFHIPGQIDAVYREKNSDGSDQWKIVDWKTGSSPTTQAELKQKALQLAVYRLAFARIQDTDPSNVTAVFYYVAEDKIIEPELASQEELEKIIVTLEDDKNDIKHVQ